MSNFLLDSLNKFNITKQKLLLAISGGVDSMVLLAQFNELKKLGLVNNESIIVTFDHHKRADSLDDAKFVYQYCLNNQLSCFIENIEVEATNFQELARNQRYQILKELAFKHGITYILSAHHADDLLESILIKFLRGSNLLGYSGFQAWKEEDGFVFVKPFFAQSKQDLITWAHSHHLDFRQDSSNDEDNYLRNKLRHHVVPLLKDYNPNILTQATRYHDTLREYFNFIRQQSIVYYQKNGGSLASFLALNPLLQKDLISYLFEQLDISFNSQIIEETIKTLQNPQKRSLIKTINPHYSLIKNWETFEIVATSPDETIYTLEYYSTPPSIQDQEQSNYNVLCYNNIDYPLSVRKPARGDLLKMTYGTKSLKKLMIEKQIPSYRRNQLLVLVDRHNNILYVEDIYINRALGDDHQLYIKKIGPLKGQKKEKK